MGTGWDALAIIKGYGRTVEGSLGFRCEKARILAFVPVRYARSLNITWAHARALKERYGVPYFGDYAEMLAHFPYEHQAKLSLRISRLPVPLDPEDDGVLCRQCGLPVRTDLGDLCGTCGGLAKLCVDALLAARVSAKDPR